MNISQSKFATLVAPSETLVIESQQVQNGRVEVVNMDWILSDVHSEIIGLTVRNPAFNSTSGQPHRIRVFMMITPGHLVAFPSAALTRRSCCLLQIT